MSDLEVALAQSATLSDELAALEDDLTSATASLTSDLAKALIQGQELDGLLQELVLDQADRALNSALQPVYDLVGDAGASVVGAIVDPLLGGIGGVFTGSTGAATTQSIYNVNVSTPDAESFRASETQVASSLSRAVTRGTRGL